MLCDDFNSKVIFLNLDIGAVAYSLHQSALYLGTCIVGMMQYAEFRVSALAVQVELSVILAIKVDAPLHQFLYLLRSLAHHLLYGGTVGDVVAGYHGIFDVLVEIVEFKVGYRSHTTLCKRGICLVERSLAD